VRPRANVRLPDALPRAAARPLQQDAGGKPMSVYMLLEIEVLDPKTYGECGSP
jgi:hypothetical protein